MDCRSIAATLWTVRDAAEGAAGEKVTNVIGNCLAAAIIARWEGELREPADEAAA